MLGLGDAFVFVWNFLRLPVLVVALVLWLTLLLHYAPSRRVGWRHALPGALLTAVLWFVASAAFHVYLAVAASRNPLLGAFGGGVIIMSWVPAQSGPAARRGVERGPVRPSAPGR